MTELKKKKTPGYSHRQIAPPATSFTSAPQFPVWRNLFSGPYPPPKKKPVCEYYDSLDLNVYFCAFIYLF